MRQQIRAWKEEHRKFEKLLMLIEGELDVFRAGEQPNYALLLDAVLYMTQYPVRFHDPKEDLAWKIVLERLPSSARLVDSLHRQHALVARSGNDLRRLGDSLMADVFLPRAQVERAARGYIDAFRIQLGMEERLMLPLAQGLLSEDDWAGLRARFQAHGDAASRTTMRRRYRALHRRIAREAGCGCATQ